MSYQPQKLMLVKGLPSSASLGNTGTTDLPPVTVNLRDGIFGLYDEQPFAPQLAGLKENAAYSDPVTVAGRELIAGEDQNVIETVYLRANPMEGTQMARAAALHQLRLFSQAAQRFWTERHLVDPVYLVWQASEAPFEQYALVTSIKVKSLVDGFIPNRIGLLTLEIEREPYWRPVAPGGNPKLFAFQQRGLVENVGYQHDDLSLTAFGGSADLQAMVEATVYPFDESTSPSHTGNVNYVDIPASACVGDAPIPALVVVNCGAGSPSLSEVHLALSTARDLYSDEAGNVQNRRLGNTMNAADAFIFSADVDLTVTALTDGIIGVYSAFSAANRSILGLYYNANAVEGMACYWTRNVAQFSGRYAVFLRAEVSSGTASDIAFRVGVNIGTSGTPTSDWVYFPSGSYAPLYLGEVDAGAPGRRPAHADGTGLLDDGVFSLYLHTKKAAGAVANVKLIDLVLMPIDEAYLSLTSETFLQGDFFVEYMIADTTGYLAGGPVENVPAKVFTNQPQLIEHAGAALYLRPGVRNRLYFMPVTAAPSPAQTYQIRVNVLPRWAGIRDE
jgi:hypothetical protein